MFDHMKPASGYIYLATPYSRYPGGIHAAAMNASILTARLIEIGIPVFSPIAHSHPVAIYGGIDPFSHDFWLPVCEPMMAASAGILVAKMQSWDQSIGIAHEIAWFERAGKPVHFLDESDLRILCPGYSL